MTSTATLRSRHPILLLADHKWRDLPGLANLKVILEDKYKLSVRIVPYGQWSAALLAFRPSVVCPTTMTGPREQAIARAARRLGAAVVVIPAEGVPADDDILPYQACTHVDLSDVDLWLTWNDVMRDFMIANKKLRADQIVTTGANRFDFYVPPLRRLLRSKQELETDYRLEPGRPIVSWATNFAHAGFVTHDPEFIKKDWTVRGLTSIRRYSAPREFAEADARAQQAAHTMMREVFRRLPDVNFIVKTHPAERLDVYLQYLASWREEGLRNVFLVNREYIGDVLNAASVHIHRFCTTGIEAWIMGVPTLNLDLGGWHLTASSGGSLGDAAKLDVPVSDAETICERIRFYVSNGELSSSEAAARQAHLRRWLTQLDGHTAERQASAIAQIVAGRPPRVRWRPLALGRRLPGAIKGVLRMALNAARSRPLDTPLRQPARYRGFEINELGYIDRVTRQTDVDMWCRKIRQFRAEVSRHAPAASAASPVDLRGAVPIPKGSV